MAYHGSPAMPKAVSRMLMLLCTLMTPLPVGTNLGLLHLLWMLVSGRLLAARGAVIPGLDACGLARGAVRRGGAAPGSARAGGPGEAGAGGALGGAGGRCGGVGGARGAWARPAAQGRGPTALGPPGASTAPPGRAAPPAPRPGPPPPYRGATPPAYRGRGRPPTRGAVVRPLVRTYKGRMLAATPPDAVLSWEEAVNAGVKIARIADAKLPSGW